LRCSREMMMKTPPSAEQAKDIDFLLTAGEMFTLVVYGQLMLENAKIYGTWRRSHRPDF
jgi:acyl-CoA dehydrogenase